MKLSIIISAYNRPLLLARLLSSLAIQTDRRFEVAIANDNSSDQRVDDLSRAFVKTFNGIYALSDISAEDRPKQCRYSVTVNSMLAYVTGEIVTYFADDHEATPTLVETVLKFFEDNPHANVGYVGQGYRFAEFRTGELYPNRPFGGRDTPGGVMKEYPGWVNYGGVVERAFAVFDTAQFFHRREYAVVWETDPEYWMGADAHAMEGITRLAGSKIYPIGDVFKPLVWANWNESSLTMTESPERTVAILKGER